MHYEQETSVIHKKDELKQQAERTFAVYAKLILPKEDNWSLLIHFKKNLFIQKADKTPTTLDFSNFSNVYMLEIVLTALFNLCYCFSFVSLSLLYNKELASYEMFHLK